MNDFKGNFHFNEAFFNAINAPQYRVEVVEATEPESGYFRNANESMVMLGDDLGTWHTFQSVGAEILENTALGTKVNFPNGGRIARIKGHVIPEAYQPFFIVDDPLGQEGNMHHLQGFESIGGGMVQAIYESLTSHPAENGETSEFGNYFGMRWGASSEMPKDLHLHIRPSYAVDYNHLYVAPFEQGITELWENLVFFNIWPPDNVDLTAAYLQPGRYPCSRAGKHILYRVL